MNMKKPRMPKASGATKMPKAGMSMPRFGARAMRPGGMAKGGKVHPDEAMDLKLIRKEIARAEKMEEKSEAKVMKNGGEVKKMAFGGRPSYGKPVNMPGGRPSYGKPAGMPGGRPSAIRSQSVGSMSIPTSGLARSAPVGTGKPAGMVNPPQPRMMARGGGVERKGKTKGKLI